MKKLLCLLLAAVTLLALCGCDIGQPQEEAETPIVFAEVFNDGITSVETRRLMRLPGSSAETEYCFLEVRLANNDVAPIYYSSLLCLKASSGGTTLSTQNAVAATNAATAEIADYFTLDGEISPGEAAEGFIFFEAPKGLTAFDISIATNFGADKWVSFSCQTQ